MTPDIQKKKIGKRIGIVILCILLNIIGRCLAEGFALPVLLDMIGTTIAAYYVGVGGGIFAGVIGNVLLGFIFPNCTVYALTSFLAALAISVFVRKRLFDHLSSVLVIGLVLGILCTIVSVPINLGFFSGKTDNMWGDALLNMLEWYGVSKLVASILADLLVEVADKQITVLIAYLLFKIEKRWTGKRNKQGAETKIILSIMVLAILLFIPDKAYAESKAELVDNYVYEIMNNTSGMMSSEANTIAETTDGYIWIGSYAGLTRYDGVEFEYIRKGNLASVTAMITDRLGRL